MICPKCGNEQEQSDQCQACGIYIEKYRKAQQEKNDRARDVTRKRNESSGSAKKIIGIIFLGAIALYIFSGGDEPPENTPVTDAQSISNGLEAGESVSLRLAESHPPKNAIEKARNATVFIQTEWGTLGSGFIVDKSCRVITNRHVVEFDIEKRIGKLMASRQYQREIAHGQQEIFVEISRLRIKYREALALYGRGYKTDEIKSEIEVLLAKLENLPSSINEEIKDDIAQEAEKYSHSNLKVSLVDGTEYSVSQVVLSDKYDLATFNLAATDCPFISSTKPELLAQGERLYTIGNPSGLTYTVTSGVFSGFRTENEKSFLQTDAPINPGNSGGPLINKRGKVIGINTMVLKKAQNIGFAIPVTSVDDAF